MKYEVLHILKKNTHTFVSGQLISDKLGVSRTAVWKYINNLKKEGYIIDSSSKKGYKLLESPDMLSFEEIEKYLKTKYIGKKIVYLESVDSTNNKAKELASKGENHGTLVIAEEQLGGRGRLGRAWCSPKYKGIWLSIILRPDINPMQIPKLTQIAAASVIESLKDFKIEATIKWPNDIILNGKKICGILTEMNAEMNKVHYVVLGIGINANLGEEDFQKDILSKATSIKIETGLTLDRKSFVGNLVNKFEYLYEEFEKTQNIESSIKICRTNSAVIGKIIRIIRGENETFAKALDLDENGGLIVQYENGTRENLISGEISIRGLNGYI